MKIDFQDNTTRHIFVVSSMIAFGMLVLVITGLITYYTATRDHVTTDSASQTRLDDLNEVLKSMLGNNWPVLLFVFAIILLLFLAALYVLTRKQYNISDASAQKLYYVFIGFTVIFSIAMIILGVRAFLSNKDANKSGDLDDYIPYQDQKKQNEMILGIIALGIFILGCIGGLIWYIKKKKPNLSLKHMWNRTVHGASSAS